jgi:hemerythrin-like domain-containing protein
MGFARNHTRRQFLWAGTAAAGGLLAASGLRADEPAKKAATEKMAEDVSPVEDLMREHGVLRRLLLVYEEVGRRLADGKPVSPELLSHAAHIIRSFVEDYHERQEEEHVFPRLVKAGKLVSLTKILAKQHDAGRWLTGRLMQAAEKASLPTGEASEPLRKDLQLFVRMYRPHAAREDTVLLPALHGIMTAKEYDVMGDRFEDREHELFGEDGFERYVGEVTQLEKASGIEDLAQFTPPHPVAGG